MADEKIGAYICRGCGIGERLDTEALARVAQREGKAAVARTHDFLCSEAGVAAIRADLEAGEADRVVIAACSRRAKTDAFAFDGVPLTRASLREGVVWIRPDSEDAREASEEMAADYLRMACAEARFTRPPSGNRETGESRQVLVVGGGVTGMTVALEVARAGYRATIVEKTGALGGHTAKLWRKVPSRSPYAEPQPTGVEALVAQVLAEPDITVHLSSTVTRTSGAPGRFSADITGESGGTGTENFGAIVQASGFTPYDPAKLPQLGHGRSPDVVDQLGMEALAREAAGGAIRRPSDGREVRSVVFVQCAGQRSSEPGHLPYCSGHCCNTSIKQALYVKEADPEVDATVLFTDLRTPGNGEDFYRSAQRRGVTFSKGVVNEVVPEGEGLAVRFRDLILAEDTAITADLVVLATGMVPNSGVDIATAPAEGTVEIPVESILNLDYRQGRDVPQLVHGFTDSHFICFPYETQRTGIYTAGPVRRPMDLAQVADDAAGAALKAVQAIENAGHGRAAHPRSGDLSFPSFRRDGCTQCKRCTVECPFGAIDEDEQRYPVFNESRCRRCGTCMGACPVRVISFENYSIDTVGGQIKAVEIPDESEGKPRILVLACENDAYPALDMAAMNRIQSSAHARVVPVRCLGSVNTIWVTDALNGGYDGVILMGCQKGENYQCHFVRGSEMAHYRMSKIDDTLTGLGLETERVRTCEVAITDIRRAPRLIDEMAETIERIGLSPMKF